MNIHQYDIHVGQKDIPWIKVKCFKNYTQIISVVEMVYFVVFPKVELYAFWDLKVPDENQSNFCCWPFNSHEWPWEIFSLQYQYDIKQKSDENKEKYQLGDY